MKLHLLTIVLALSTELQGFPSLEPVTQDEEEAVLLEDRKVDLLKTADWLLAQRNEDLHWGSQTWLALLALSEIQQHYGTNCSWRQLAETKQALSQLDIQLISSMLKSTEDNAEPDFSLYAHNAITLTSLCRDPKSFYGRNLIGGLPNSSNPSKFAYAYKLLAVCNAGGNISRNNLKQLIDLLDINSSTHDLGPDTISITILAATCIGQHYPDYAELQLLVSHRLKQLATLQDTSNGSMDKNIVSTSLAAQVFRNFEIHSDGYEAAIRWLNSAAGNDHSFGDVFNTVEAVLALTGRGRLGIDIRKCPIPEEKEPTEPVEKVSFTYVVWFQQDVVMKQSIELTVPVDITFFQAMQRAALDNPAFRFEAKEFSFGHLVTSIGGVAPGPSQAWMLYVLPVPPDSNGDPEEAYKDYLSKYGVDVVKPKEGDFVLFWLKNVSW